MTRHINDKKVRGQWVKAAADVLEFKNVTIEAIMAESNMKSRLNWSAILRVHRWINAQFKTYGFLCRKKTEYLKLTETQTSILRFVDSFIKAHGRPPTTKEATRLLQFSYDSGTRNAFLTLFYKGVITHPGAKSPPVQITPVGRKALIEECNANRVRC